MADPTNELILKVLQQIQATQGAPTRLLEEHTSGFTQLGRRLDEVQESMTMALGLTRHANIRHDRVSERPEDLTRRNEVLERAK